MHAEFLRDSAIGELDIYYMSDQATAASTRSFLLGRIPNPNPQLFPWGSIPADVDTTRVLKLCVEHRDASVVVLPDVIRTLPNLLWLAIQPLRDCPTLTDLWLENLTKLTSIASLADLPRLRELSVTYYSKLQLDRSLLRRLMFFACKDIGLAPLRPEIERLGLDHFLASGTR